MNLSPIESNPFALLLDAEAVMARVTASPRLALLNSRVCRPLDKPLLGRDAPDADTDSETDIESSETFGSVDANGERAV